MSDIMLTVEVTQEDIAMGIPEWCRDCALALAISRALGTPVAVAHKTFFPTYEGSWYRHLSAEAVKFRRAFDGGQSVSPFTFQQPVPADAVAR